MTKILCDQCGGNADNPHRIMVKSATLLPAPLDFCSHTCFLKWTEKKKPKMDHHEFVRLAKSTVKHDWVSCANCEGVGCLVCEGKGGFGVDIGPTP